MLLLLLAGKSRRRNQLRRSGRLHTGCLVFCVLRFATSLNEQFRAPLLAAARRLLAPAAAPSTAASYFPFLILTPLRSTKKRRPRGLSRRPILVAAPCPTDPGRVSSRNDACAALSFAAHLERFETSKKGEVQKHLAQKGQQPLVWLSLLASRATRSTTTEPGYRLCVGLNATARY